MNKLFNVLAFAAMTTAIPASAAFNWDADVTPATGVVSELGEIQVNYKNITNPSWALEISTAADIVLKYEGVQVTGTKAKVMDRTTLCVTMPEAKSRTTPGTYRLEIGEYAISVSKGEMSRPEDCPALAYEWTIEASGTVLDFSCASSLPNDEFLAYFGELTFTFDKLDKVEYSGVGVSVLFNGNEVADVAVTTDANKLTLTLKDALNFVEGTVAVEIAPEALTGIAGGETAPNHKPISASYKMATPVEYDLALDFSNPKPNADGQVSANRSLESFFFRCEQGGLVATPGDALNVTMKEVGGDFEATGHLRKSPGGNADYTPFSVSFGKEPAFNGIYTITIAKGAFGTAAWSEDPNYGHSNAEIVLNFELVDGYDHEDYTIVPTRIDPAAGTYEKGSALSVITFEFEDGVVATKKASGTLAGFTSSYREEVRFVAVDGGYSLTFSPAPTDKGKYLLTVPAGSFTDDEGNASAPLALDYIIGTVTGVDLVGADGEVEIHDMSGRRVDKNRILSSGLYIINGRKVLVK